MKEPWIEPWIINRYQEGQDSFLINEIGEYNPRVDGHPRIYVEVYFVNGAGYLKLTLHEFLFNPQWKFAIAFWGTEGTCSQCGSNRPCLCGSKLVPVPIISKYEYYIQRLAVFSDPITYLQRFKN